jgi:hypothetical protein
MGRTSLCNVTSLESWNNHDGWSRGNGRQPAEKLEAGESGQLKGHCWVEKIPLSEATQAETSRRGIKPTRWPSFKLTVRLKEVEDT